MQTARSALAFSFAIAVTANAANAHAAAPTCGSLDVGAEPAVATRWPAIEDDVRAAFADRDDVDRCAHVMLVAHGHAIVAEVTLPDGRSTSRAVTRREDVLPALEPLLLLPGKAVEARDDAVVGVSEVGARREEEASPADAAPVSITMAPAERAPAPDAVSRATPRATNEHRIRFEISAVTGARVGDGQFGLGIGAQSFLEVSSWLVGFSARADGYQTLSGQQSAGVLGLGVLGGRRLWIGKTVTWDFVLGPAAAIQGTDTYESDTPRGHVSVTASGIVPRLVTGTRFTFAARSLFRTFVGIDGELGPDRDSKGIPEAPKLPIWTLGLAIGATVGTP